MSKRRAQESLTREGQRKWEDEIENDRDKIDPVQIASEEIMATRKVAIPRRSRLANANSSIPQQPNGLNGNSGTAPPTTSSGGLFSSVKAPVFSFGASSSFGASKPPQSSASNLFAKNATPAATISTTFTATSSTEPKPANPFGAIKTTSEVKSLFPQNSPFAKPTPAPAPSPSLFTREMAAQTLPETQFQPFAARSGGPIRTPRHSVREPAPVSTLQTPQQSTHSFQTTSQPSSFNRIHELSAAKINTPGQGSLSRSNGDSVPIATPQNKAEAPEKTYWQRIKAMNEAFHESVGRSLASDPYCNLDWLFGQYKFWLEEIEKGFPYDPKVDSPAPAARLKELKAGVTMKPASPVTQATSFVRSQAPPPESQVQALPSLWDGGSTQSTERTRSFGKSEDSQKVGSKTAETILGVLASPVETIGNVGIDYKKTMESVQKRQEHTSAASSTPIFSFGKTSTASTPVAPSKEPSGPLRPFSFAETSKPSAHKAETPTSATFPKKPDSSFASSSTSFTSFSSTSKPFTFGQPIVPSKPQGFGQSSTFPTTVSNKPLSSSAFPSKPSTSSLPPPVKVQNPSIAVKAPSKKEEPPVSNRFAAFSQLEPEDEVITIESDDEEAMADDRPEEDQEMDEDEEEEELEEQDEIEDEGAEEDEEMDDEVQEDDVKDEDYIVLDDEEEPEDQEEEPVAEEVAKEVEELVKSSPERKEQMPIPQPVPAQTKSSDSKPAEITGPPFTFRAPVVKSASNTMDDQVPKIQTFEFGKSNDNTEGHKTPEMTEIQPAPSITENPFAKYLVKQAQEEQPKPEEAKPQFKFGLPSTPSTFRGAIPELDRTPASALRKEFKFGLPIKSAEPKEQPKPEELKEAEKPKEEIPTKEPTRMSMRLRSASPSKRPADDQETQGPSKRKRSVSPRKQLPTKEATPKEETQAPPPSEKQEMPHVQPVTEESAPPVGPATEQPKPFSFGATFGEPKKDAQGTPKPFTFGANIGKDYTWTPDKPIKFDTPPSSITAKPTSATFAFGQSTGLAPFKFGGLSTPVPPPPQPKFGLANTPPTGAFNAFSGANVSFTPPNVGFSFGQAKTEAQEEKQPAKEDTKLETQSETQAPDGEEGEDETPVVSEEVGNEGEEDEETVFSERAKLIQRLTNTEREKEITRKGAKPEDVKWDRDYGVGVFRVNVHKETKKPRILFRLEGSGRVVLNSYLIPDVDYVKKGNYMVLVPASSSEGTGLSTYFVRVKDGSIADTLAKTLQEKKSVA